MTTFFINKNEMTTRTNNNSLVLRISLDESTSDSDEEMTIKFGASMAEAEQLLVAAKEMHLNVVGIRYSIVLC